MNSETTSDSKFQLAIRVLISGSLIALGVWLAVSYRDQISLEKLAESEAELRNLKETSPVVVYGGAFLIYVLVTGLSLPGAVPLSLAIGWFFGWWRGVLLVSFASTIGATVAFVISRFVLRDAIQAKFGDRLAGFNRALEREGAFYLFTLRLIPAVPFFVINVVMGLTPIRTRTFYWVSQIGMLPGTIVFLYAGSSVPSLKQLAQKGTSGILSPQLFAAFLLLGIFPWGVKQLMGRLRKTKDSP